MDNSAKLTVGTILRATVDSPDGHWKVGAIMRVLVPMGDQEIDNSKTAYVFILNPSFKKRDRYIYEICYSDVELHAEAEKATLTSFEAKLAAAKMMKSEIQAKEDALATMVDQIKGTTPNLGDICDLLT